ncbi:MAG: aldehyde dehydrogenase family protein [Thaumarchaeota archaeon]|nr:MAG: aldehyde dehydrogenase family protein [Nitrososphaerota archaeon]
MPCRSSSYALKLGQPRVALTHERIDDVKASGEPVASGRRAARVVADGRTVKVVEHPDGFFLGASVLDGVEPTMKVAKEDVFGPLASVILTEPRRSRGGAEQGHPLR